MNQGIQIVLPKSFEEYDDMTDFMDDAKVFTDSDKAIEHFKSLKSGSIFHLDLYEPLAQEEKP